MNYFKEELTGFDSWARVYCSREAFGDLANYIFKKEGLLVQEGIQNLTPGSNAVFKADNYVIKIFAPIESSFDTEADYHTELAVLSFAKAREIAIPKIIASGSVIDKYLFRYIIMEFIDGQDACDVLPDYNRDQKKDTVNQIKTILKNLNQPVDDLIKKKDLVVNTVRNERLSGLSEPFIAELITHASNLDLSEMVLVHGDITGENARINSDGELMLIDFADCMIAPSYYELSPIIFELFRCDREFVHEFVGDKDKDIFLDELIDGLSIHMFCGNIIKDFLKRSEISCDSITSILGFKELIKTKLYF